MKPRYPRQQLWFPCGRYFVRTIKREDASDRWGEWLSDPWMVHVLNIAPRKLSKGEIADYIRSFDQRERLLLGIFERGTRAHVGFYRFDIDHERREALINAIIGESKHRNSGATVLTGIPIMQHLFAALKLDRINASVLERNTMTMNYMLKLGWQPGEGPATVMPSRTDGTSLTCRNLVWTADAFRTFMNTPLGQRLHRQLQVGGRP